MRRHLEVKIYGLVQGVFYRHSAKKEAGRLDIKGFVKNEPDGSVCIEAEGEEENLKDFLEWLKEGPPLARVEKIESRYKPTLKNFQGFTIE